eukprot:1510755-Prymnesium_polylepis.1
MERGGVCPGWNGTREWARRTDGGAPACRRATPPSARVPPAAWRRAPPSSRGCGGGCCRGWRMRPSRASPRPSPW